MPKIDLDTLTNLQNEASAVAQINANNVLIEAAFDQVLFRTGTPAATDNAMAVDLDMNTQRIINLPAPTSATEPARHGDIDTYVTDAAASATAAATSETNAATSETNAAASAAAAAADEASAQAVLTEIETHSINSGVSTPVAVGTKSSGTYTPEPADGALLTGTKGGAFTLAAMTGTGWYRLMLINNASAGTITTSGWDVTIDGDSGLSNNAENSVIEYIGINDGVKKVLQVNVLVDATP